MPTNVYVCTGTSDKHCEEALPKTKPTARKKRRREANWCAEAAFELEEFGTQSTPGLAAATTPAPAKQRKLRRTTSLAEHVKAELDFRKARKSAEQPLPGSSPGTAQLDVADGLGSDDMLPATEMSADRVGRSLGSDSDTPENSAVEQEAGADVWAEVLAEERDPQPSQTQALPSTRATKPVEAAFESKQAEMQQPEPGVPLPKRISPSLMQRRSTRGIIDAEALNSPPRGAPQKGRQPVQQHDATCTLSFQGMTAEHSQRRALAAGRKALAAAHTAAKVTAKAKQMRQASNAIKAQRDKGGA